MVVNIPKMSKVEDWSTTVFCQILSCILEFLEAFEFTRGHQKKAKRVFTSFHIFYKTLPMNG